MAWVGVLPRQAPFKPDSAVKPSAACERRPPSVPIRRGLVCERCIQYRLIGKPATDELHTDRHTFHIHAAGNRAAWQPEHTRETQKVGMIVARVARVVAVAF